MTVLYSLNRLALLAVYERTMKFSTRPRRRQATPAGGGKISGLDDPSQRSQRHGALLGGPSSSVSTADFGMSKPPC